MATAKVILALDSGSLIQATKNPKIEAVIRKWIGEGAEVVIPAPCLSEALHGSPKDAPAERIINAVQAMLPPTATIARRAGVTLGHHRSRATVDAMIVATAIAHRATEIMTTDPRGITVFAGDELNVIAV